MKNRLHYKIQDQISPPTRYRLREYAQFRQSEELADEALERRPDLALHRDDIVSVVHAEMSGRDAYLQSNVVEGKLFKEAGEAEREFYLAEPVELIRLNGHVPPAEKLKLIRSRPWRVFPIDYGFHIADWEGTAKMDSVVDSFLVQCEAAGHPVTTWPPEVAMNAEVNFGMEVSNGLLFVTRTRDVAWFAHPDAGEPPISIDERQLSVRKRSVFLLDVSKQPVLEEMVSEYIKILNITNEGIAGDPLNRAYQQRYSFLRERIMEAIDGHLAMREDSEALVPIATGYSLRQYEYEPLDHYRKIAAAALRTF